MLPNLALIALGANMSSLAGPPGLSIRFALQLINRHRGLTLGSASRIYRTPAHPPGSGPDYANACATLRTTLAAPALLEALHEIEAQMGRRRDGGRWAARGIDIDLLAMGEQVAPDAAVQDQWRALAPDQQQVLTPDGLILPHPRLQDRAFVLVPLAEIAPGWRHPRTGKTVADMLAALPADDRGAMRVWLDNQQLTDHIASSALSDSNR